MKRTLVILCAVAFLGLALGPSRGAAGQKSARKSARKEIYLTVAAGAHDRRGTIVSFPAPADWKSKHYVLFDGRGPESFLVLQVDATRQATFVLPELKAGAEKTYLVQEIASTRTAPTGAGAARVPYGGVEPVQEGSRLVVRNGGKEVIGFQTKPELPEGVKPVFARAGYIHPVYTPSGTLVTDDYPSDHYHHHGVWAAWTKTEFEGRHPDFWNVHDGTGRVDFVGVDRTWYGVVHGGFTSRQRYVDVKAAPEKVALDEEWEVTVYSVTAGAKPYTVFDLVLTQRTSGASPLKLEEYRYGGVGVRGHREWKDKAKFFFLTSEGKGRADGNATRGRWCHLGGTVAGQTVGLTTFDHPQNLRAPQPMRLNPDDPFFNWAPSQTGPFEIKPGEQFVLRYRFVAADGPPDRAELDRLWQDYATPPQVTVTSR